MCGRYALELAAEHPQYLAGVQLREAIVNYNIPPTSQVPILVDLPDPAGGFDRQLHPARWGLIPAWAQEVPPVPTFNARSETALEKPSFRQAALSGHCAFPISGYYEWQVRTGPSGKQARTPYFVHRADGRPIYLAGLYEWWRVPLHLGQASGPWAGRAGEWVLTASILTMDSPGQQLDTPLGSDAQEMARQLGWLHERLPIPLGVAQDSVLSEDDPLTAWLRSGQLSPCNSEEARHRQAQAALESIRQQALDQVVDWQLRQVDERVGSVRNNDAQLLEPVEDLFSAL